MGSYSYGDGQAVEDGVLARITPTHRATSAVWHSVQRSLEEHTTVDASAIIQSWIIEHHERATSVWKDNIGGGVLKLRRVPRTPEVEQIEMQLGYIEKDFRVIPVPVGEARKDDMWLIPNELGGVTLMFPSDY
jgi:hypothetical protein